MGERYAGVNRYTSQLIPVKEGRMASIEVVRMILVHLELNA